MKYIKLSNNAANKTPIAVRSIRNIEVNVKYSKIFPRRGKSKYFPKMHNAIKLENTDIKIIIKTLAKRISMSFTVSFDLNLLKLTFSIFY